MEIASNKIVSVIIVTGGRDNYLRLCLESLKTQTYSHFEVIVIDNSLNPNFIRDITEYYPFIKSYSSKENLFYCQALNIGIKMSAGEFILCLNDDVTLDKKYIEETLKAFNVDKRIGMVCSKILRSDRKTIDSTGLFLSPWRAPKERGYSSKDKRRYEREQYVFAATGAAAFYRRKMLEDLKIDAEYFDTDFRLFYEDLDIAWRAQNFGWKAYYIPSAVAYHVRGGSARAARGIDKPYARRYLSDDLHADLIKNRHLTIIKNESCLGFILHLPFILFYDFLAYSYVLFFRPTLLKKIILNFKYLKSAFRKRIAIKEEHKLQHECKE